MPISSMNSDAIQKYYDQLHPETQKLLDVAIERIVEQKHKGGKVMVITGSGPNIHEGVTSLVAELMDKGIVDAVSTSSGVVAHEMAGTLDKVKRFDGTKLGLSRTLLPKGNTFEITQMGEEQLALMRKEMMVDEELIQRGNAIEGDIIIKAAGNMGYPMGLRTERLAREILAIARTYGLPFETVAGWGADPCTMLGVGARKELPVLVSVPQLIGGGGVGLAIGDSISISERCMRMSKMMESSAVLIESAIALTQEIHDGPFETYTGHGVWAGWDGYQTISLEGKTLVRIDLDLNLKRAWDLQRNDATVQQAIDKGLPKAKLTGIPFRMEMSGFARLENSLPLIGDIGIIWPVLACKVAQALDVKLDFVSHPQQTPEGQAMREWIVENIRPVQRDLLLKTSQVYRRGR
ncbi:MAG: hypothetical protein ABSE06_01005 [Anaerolineaceae bacterium]